MKVKRFFAESMQVALRQVREELGADAVILSNTRINGGVEVVAALDYEENQAKEAITQMLSREAQPSPSQIARMHAEKHVQLQNEMERARRRIETVRVERAEQGAAQARAQKSQLNGIEALLNPEAKARLQTHVASQQARPAPLQKTVAESKPARPEPVRQPVELAVRKPVNHVSQPLSKPVSARTDSARLAASPEQPTAQRKRSEWDALSDMHDEIQSLKEMIKSTQGQHTRPEAPSEDHRSDVAKNLGERLSSLGISGMVREALLRAAQGIDDADRAWVAAMTKLESLLRIEAGEMIDQPGVVALVGATGAGKTMTIGKMASRYVMKYGADSIALVTMDRYRIAAHEQLKVFGRILNVPVYAVNERGGLDAMLDKLADKRLILVDTAGLQHSDPGWSDQIQELKLSRHKIKPYLVLSVVGQYQVMCSQYHYYRMATLAGVILTKLDEAVSLGELLTFLAASKLPAAYLTDGQRVPLDLHRVDKKALIERALKLLNSSERWVGISGDAEREMDAYRVQSA